jgi:hypothetical protein
VAAVKVTKYPNRVTVSLSQSEYAALLAIVANSLKEFGDGSAFAWVQSNSVRRVLDIWARGTRGTPFKIDVEKPGRGGSAT